MDPFHQLAIQGSQEDLIKFAITYQKDYQANWHHKVIAHYLQEVEKGKIKRLIIETPPRHGKSRLATVMFPTWYLGRNSEDEIITASYSGELASKFGGDARDIIQDQQYQAIFPHLKLKADSKSKDKWNTHMGGSYTSVGVGGAITGRGADLLIIDDPIKNREEAESQVIRDKIWDWYRSTAYTRLEKGGAVVVIQTRWHLDDLVGRLLDQQERGGDEWLRIQLPAVALEDEKFRKTGVALWPDKYDLDALANIKNNIGVYEWQALYQQNPIAAETQEFKQHWFRYFSPEDPDHKNKNLYYYTMVDLAVSKKETADNVSIITISKEKDKPEIYIEDELTGKLDPGQVVDYIFTLKARYGHRYVRAGIETVAYQESLLYWLTEEMRKREEYIEIVELKAKAKKEDRIRGLKAMYKAGVLHHQRSQKELEEELLVFPQGRHDDRIDALAYLRQVLPNTSPSAEGKRFVPTFVRKGAYRR